MTHDDFVNRAERIDREIKEMIDRLASRTEEQRKEDEEWAEQRWQAWIKKHAEYVRALQERRAALEELLSETFGPWAFECEEAPDLRTAGRIPDSWRPR